MSTILSTPEAAIGRAVSRILALHLRKTGPKNFGFQALDVPKGSRHGVKAVRGMMQLAVDA